ncbi:MAG: C1 family peptidase [Desulfobacterales bacterium]|nr:C1 family peptidase [Desulfobacterales bacterium]
MFRAKRRCPRRLSKLFCVLLINVGVSLVPATAGSKTAVDLRGNMTPVKHQGSRNTCSVFAATSLMEFLIKDKTGRTVDLSESYNYWAGKKRALTSDFLRERYANMDGLAGFLAVEAYRHGSMLESQWPYQNQTQLRQNDPRCRSVADKGPTECFTGLPPKRAQLLRYAIEPTYIPREKIGNFILRHNKPVVLNVLWCEGALNRRTGGFRLPTNTEVQDAIRNHRGHVITLVGFNPRTRTFVYRNSYGPNWGRNGYGTLPEDYVINYCEVCPLLKNRHHASPPTRAFLHRASMGVSGKLVKSKTGAELPEEATGPRRLVVSFPAAHLVYVPAKRIVQVSVAGAVVSSAKAWETKTLRSHLYLLQKKSWRNFSWKINTNTRRLYRAEHGSADKVKGVMEELTGETNRPERIKIRFDDAYIVSEPTEGMLQLIVGGAVLSYGDDWRMQQIGPLQYHLAKAGWKGFFWLVDASREKLYAVTDARFGEHGGRQKMLAAEFEIER